MTVSVVGAGAFGTGLAISLAAKTNVCLWARSEHHVRHMAEARENVARLPGIALPSRILVTGDMAKAAMSDVILMAVPTQILREVIGENSNALTGKSLIACCKGAETGTGLGPVGVITDVLPDTTAALLTGPSFARDIANGLPTALTLACEDLGAAAHLQKALTTANLRLYRSSDVAGAEMGGALKNVIAIACGAVMGAGLGESARAALMTRGYAEMVRFAVSRGARVDTLAGLSGLGDLALTCTSGQSRNYRRGIALGRGEPFDPSVTVEGAATAEAIARLAGNSGLDLPITQAVVALLNGKITIDKAVETLLARPLKEE